MTTLLFPGLVWFLCLFLGFFCSLPLLGICHETPSDREALLCFKSRLSAPAGVLPSWSNTSMEFCDWHGITCSATSPRHVIALDLESQGISGTIAPCIANLTWLARLQLSNNSFGGGVPSELGLLSRLTNLNLSMNSLEGNIPPELSACSQLQILGLWNNSLHGEIPHNLSQCKHLQEINLGNNKLQGSIPPAFGVLLELRILVLAKNTLTGTIPLSLGSSRHLTYVDLGSNALGGVIPESLANSSSTKGDVYSFGVLLLQLITGCSPTNEHFKDGISLHEFVDRAFTNNIHEVVDPTMLQDDSSAAGMMENCVIPLLRIGLSCSMTSPKERPCMGQVSTEILKIRHVASDTCTSDEAKNWHDGRKQQNFM